MSGINEALPREDFLQIWQIERQRLDNWETVTYSICYRLVIQQQLRFKTRRSINSDFFHAVLAHEKLALPGLLWMAEPEA